MGSFADDDIYWSRPENPTGVGVLVLAGSSGRLDVGRADVLAAAGATALAVRWFGGEGQPVRLPSVVPNLPTQVAAIAENHAVAAAFLQVNSAFPPGPG